MTKSFCGRARPRGVRRAGAAAALAAAMLALFAATPARAQLVCTTSGADETCTNTGTTNNIQITPNGNATVTNNGIVTTFIITDSLVTGNATLTNNGSASTASTRANNGTASTTNNGSFAAPVVSVTLGIGDATTTNNGSGSTFDAQTNIGNATVVNTGSATNAGSFATTGNATTINSGSLVQNISAVTGTGTATATNSGSVGGTITTQATTGNATTTNSGSVGGTVTTQTTTGDATTTNTGAVVGNVTTLSTTAGNATTTNTGSVGGFIVTSATLGNATSINGGSVAHNITTTVGAGNATTINTGSVGTQIEASTGSGNALVVNSGFVAGQTDTISSNGNATTINSGTVLGLVDVIAANGTAALINTGTIINLVAVDATTGNANVANTGIIQGQLNVHAGTLATVTNAGTISNFGGPAIVFSGGADTLNLMAGSTISGGIFLIGTNDTVNFLSGNHNLTFNTLAGATVNGPDPFVVSGNRAVAIDPTPFGLADRNLMDFTGAVSGLLDGIGAGAAANGPLSSAFAPSGSDSMAARVDDAMAALNIPALAYANDAMVFKNPTFVTQDGRAVWARGFGGERMQNPDPQNGLDGAHTQFFGGAVGFDMVARPDLRLGLFAGGGESRLSLDGNLGFTNSDMAFGGVYGRWNFASPLGRDSFLDFSLHGGGGTNSTSRTINNNTLPSGLEIATASYTSSYISPDVRYGVNIPLWAQYTLTPSVRVRYVAGFFGGYTESGTTAPLTVASRTIEDFEERGEVKLTRATPVGPDLLLTSTHIGVIGLERAGDTTVNATLLGVGLPFVTPGRNTVGGLVSGGGFEWRTREGVSFFGAGESIWFSDSSTVWSAKGGVRVAF